MTTNSWNGYTFFCKYMACGPVHSATSASNNDFSPEAGSACFLISPATALARAICGWETTHCSACRERVRGGAGRAPSRRQPVQAALHDDATCACGRRGGRAGLGGRADGASGRGAQADRQAALAVTKINQLSLFIIALSHGGARQGQWGTPSPRGDAAHWLV